MDKEITTLRTRQGFVLPVFLVLMVTLVAIVASLTYVSTVGVRQSGSRVERDKAFQIAEAGLNKAIWYLVTPVSEGGQGNDWRTEGVSEEFGNGSYTISVVDDPVEQDRFTISSQSNYQNASYQLEVLAGLVYAGRFTDYALHSEQDIDIDADADISGDVYADGDVTVEAGASVSDGTVSVTEGHDITGEGAYVEGATATPYVPFIDYAYYNEKIAVAEAGGEDVLQGDRVHTGYINLNDQSYYINGNLTVEGTVAGNGEVIVTGSIDLRNTAVINGRTIFIAKENLRVFAGTEFNKNVMLYAEDLIRVRNNFQNTDDKMAVLTPGALNIGSNVRMKGIFFGGSIKIGDNSGLMGNVIGGPEEGVLEIGQGVQLVYQDYLQRILPGFSTTVKIYKWIKK
ncbi:hypothetical protein ACFL37_01015 [Candidatus Margulisiibacteriota bacterium]